MKPRVSLPRGSARMSPLRLSCLLAVVVLLLLAGGSHGAIHVLGLRLGPLRRAHFERLKVLNPLRWFRGESDALRIRIRGLEEELSKLHMDHAILMDRLRHIQAKRVKEYSEQQRMKLNKSQEVKKITEKLKAEAADQVKKVEVKAAREKEELEKRLLSANKKSLEALQAKLERETEMQVERAVQKALDEQQARHKDDINKLIARHKEQLEKAREQLEKAKAAAGMELQGGYQARIEQAEKEAEERFAMEMEKLNAEHEKELVVERKRHKKKEKDSQAKLSELETQFKTKEQELMDKVKCHQEQMAQLQTELVRYKRTTTNNNSSAPTSSATSTTTGKRARSSKAATPPGQVPSFNKVNK